MEDAHIRTTDEVLTFFHVDPRRGLSNQLVKNYQENHGKNELPADETSSFWDLLVEQFQNKLVLILLAASAISFVFSLMEENELSFSSFVEPLVILFFLMAKAFGVVIKKTNVEKAMKALKEYLPDEVKVLREGKVFKIVTEELVPGDIVHLVSGDKIPADCRLLSSSYGSLKVDQAILTGESNSVRKDTQAITDRNAVNQNKINILFSGTTVTSGKCTAIVVQTGTNTAIGDIHESIASQISQKTRLMQKLDDFGDGLGEVILVVCILVWFINIFYNGDDTVHGWIRGVIYYSKGAVALAVAAIPQGLSVVIGTFLALGTKKMAKMNVIARGLPSVEKIGLTTVICSNKTGTLTTNQMSVNRISFIDETSGDAREFEVTGMTYEPAGEIYFLYDEEARKIKTKPHIAHLLPAMEEISKICSLCNDSKIIYDKQQETYHCIGQPIEAALKVLVEKIKTSDPSVNAKLEKMDKEQRVQACNNIYEQIYQRLATFEFTHERKSMSVIVTGRTGQGNRVQYIKGEPLSILGRCKKVRVITKSAGADSVITAPLNALNVKSILDMVRYWAQIEGLTVLALATIDHPMKLKEYDFTDNKKFSSYEQDMVFVGLVGIRDHPRCEFKDAIQTCFDAGIRVIVITSDNRNTAELVCRQTGVFGPSEDLSNKSITAEVFEELPNDEERMRVLTVAKLISRVQPSHKSQIVDLLQRMGERVAIIGDGVDDVPALKKADVGVAMGTGTDVAKLASDIVLADDNFAAIVAAIEEGRSIYSTTKQYMLYVLCSNIGKAISIFLTVLLGMPEALIPVQLLWVNLVTDGLPATSLRFNPADDDIMKQPEEEITHINKWLFFIYMGIGCYIGAATIYAYAWWFMFYTSGPQISFYQLRNFHKCHSLFPEVGCTIFTGWEAKKAATMSLSVLVIIQMFNAMNCVSKKRSILTVPPWRNIYLCLAITISMLLHFAILYIPFLSNIFQVLPLNVHEWMEVLAISFPVISLVEALKFISNTWVLSAQAGQLQ